MKKISALALAAVFGSMACSDVSSAPVASGISAPQTASNAASFRPPPPLSSLTEVSSSEFSFTVATTYFMNGPENNGWLTFSKNQPAGVSLSSPSARITIHNGTISGSGTLTYVSGDQTYVIDLASGLSKGNFSTACSGGSVGVIADVPRGSCGSFEFTATSGQRSIQGFASVHPSQQTVTSGN